jgi:ubiquinone/menaquinone biosynthesis C-methylase UbiE
VRADRVLVHVDDPQQAVNEMARVARPGAVVFIADPDLRTWVEDVADVDLGWRVMFAMRRLVPSPWVGAGQRRLLATAGLVDAEHHPVVQSTQDLALARQLLTMEQLLPTLVQSGELSDDDARSWVASREAAAAEGIFNVGWIYWRSLARKPH